MHRQLPSLGTPCMSEHREFVKMQYGRKIAQDTCMLATMRTPDWPQAPPGCIGRHNSVPCTVTTNSSSSNVRMYPYSVYTSSCHPDPHRCPKLRNGCSRHRCLSGSALQGLVPSTSADATEIQRALLRSHIAETNSKAALFRSIPLSNLVLQHSVTRYPSGRPASHLYQHSIHPTNHHHSLDQTAACLPGHSIGGAQSVVHLGFQPFPDPTSHSQRSIFTTDLLQRH
ncbi:hypothetical protein X801_02417 [Opisthorchis viverrini]|uniref:Uncharacterized protein n=2 Tax=Opisthorchis viverrini TaxID=6198 RepID=A0A074ZNM2_OPIVI|nr:hypothetical protein T265_05562 [Opisthorchis viverrini]KER27387.1 hypothetical protein T265_05562 [Opisthorchis viverrini]OON21682.1 hypothetical protein X801_02417 [Opisthorchis viverrini]